MKRFLKPGKTTDQLNAEQFEGFEDQVRAAPFYHFEEEITKVDHKASVVEVLSGKSAYFKFAAGEASRLWKSFIRAGIISKKDENNPEVQKKFRMWNLDLWEVANLVRNNLDKLKADKLNLEAARDKLLQKTGLSEQARAQVKELISGGVINLGQLGLTAKEQQDLKNTLDEIDDLNAIITGFTTSYIEGLGEKNPCQAFHMKLGIRHLMSLKLGLVKEALKIDNDLAESFRELDNSITRPNPAPEAFGELNKKIAGALGNVKLLLAVTNSLALDVISDLKALDAEGILGFKLENIRLVINDNAPGYLYNGKDLYEVPEIKKIVIDDNEEIREEILGNPNPNHGFNIIYAETPSKDGIFRYDPAAGDYIRVHESAFEHLENSGVETIAIHRTNDMIMLVPELAADISFYGLYRRLHEFYRVNHLLEVLNNFTGEKGGLLFSTKYLATKKLVMLVEGLALKSEKAKQMINRIRQLFQAKYGLKDIPYNRMYHYIDLRSLRRALNANGGLLPPSFKDDKPIKGIWSFEIPTGNITMLKGIKTAAAMRYSDTLIDNGILPSNDHYLKGSGTGALIHDFKQLKHLLVALGPALHMDEMRQRMPGLFPGTTSSSAVISRLGSLVVTCSIASSSPIQAISISLLMKRFLKPGKTTDQ
ncbi:MAG: hypothetical protein HY761_06710, partial [Candidatus Omnitrophica bacterium]|nr:hypothetical protein [Candidatus Omnitrophota bacterium]